MKRMSRMASKKSHSWWWDSHISPKNNKWLADNLEEMDRCVKEMLQLIEEEGDSFAKKSEMYYKKRPELVAHVEDFYRMYRALAERYDNVTGELRRNMTSELRSQGSGSGSDLGSEPPSPSLLHPQELTPERKPPRPKTSLRAAGFDVFLGSGGSSDLSRKGSDGSSSSSDSDSDSDGSKDANVDDMSSILQNRILELENELRSAMEKLHEEKGTNGHYEHFENGDHGDCSSRISALEKELVATVAKLSIAEADIMRLREKLAENTVLSETDGYGVHAECSSRISALEKELAVTGENLSVAEAELLSLRQNVAEKTIISETEDMDPSLEKKNLADLEELVGVLEAEISHRKQEIDDLKGVMAAANQQFDADISLRDHAIEECKTEIASLSEVYLQEKVRLEAEVTNFEGAIEKLQTEVKTISQGKLLLEAKLEERDHMIRELDNNAASAAERFLLEKSALEAQVTCLSQPCASLEAKVILLEDEVKQLEAKLEEGDCMTRDLDNNAASADERFLLEKSALEVQVTCLSQSCASLEAKINSLEDEVKQLEAKLEEGDRMTRGLDNNAASADERFLLEKRALEVQVTCLSQSCASLEAKVISLENQVKQLEAEKTVLCSENDKNIEELNKNLDGLKLKADMLTASKEELGAKVSTLIIDVNIRDERISQMNDHLHQLHLEHAKLISEIEAVRKTCNDLRSRVKGLEDEVDMQRVVILDGAEGKREAIRQLCFSLEHYRSGYYQLCQVLRGHKQPTVMAA